MKTVESALQTIRETVQSGGTESIPLANSYHRILSRDLTTPHPSPPFDKSMMDGFVLTAKSVTNELTTLQVIETVTAGDVPQNSIQAGQAIRIMTGALIPEGGDCVLPIERVTFDESSPAIVTVNASDVSPEKNILRAGFNARTGDLLMKAGTQLAAQHIAVLAEFGIAEVPVQTQPSVAVLATGDELLPVSSELQPGRIRNSNEPMLLAQLQRSGILATGLGIAADQVEDLRKKIEAGLQHDILILSGGVSAGTLDLVPSELQRAGVVEVFHKIQMKPGKPLWFGKLQSTEKPCYVFGLPGNPVSSLVCFEIFVKAALRGIQEMPEPDIEYGTLTEPMTIRGDRVTWFPCVLSSQEASVEIKPVRWTGSADLRSTADANGMCRFEPRDTAYEPGDRLPIRRW